MKPLLNKYANVLITIATVIGIMFGAFTYISSFEKRDVLLAQEITSIKKDLEILKIQKLYDEARNDYYSVKSLSQKYPNDNELKEQLKDAEITKNQLKIRIDKLKE